MNVRRVFDRLAETERAGLTLGLMFVAFVALALHAFSFYPFLSDDALISLRYARRLIQGQGLTWTGDERVEGYSDLLWVLLNAALGRIGMDLITSSRVLSFVGTLAGLVAVSMPPRGRWMPTPPRVIGGAALLAATVPCAVWAIGGLEHGLLGGLVGWIVVLIVRALETPERAVRHVLTASLLLGFVAILRVDGPVFTVAAAVAILLGIGQIPTRLALKLSALVVALPLVFFAAQLIFRLSYYGEWVPNTALAKVSFSNTRFGMGFRYVEDGLGAVSIAVAAALAGAALMGKAGTPRSRFVVPLVFSSVWIAYIMSVGGDIFPGWRQLLPAIVPLALLTADGVEGLWERYPKQKLVLSTLWIGALCAYVQMQSANSENVRARRELWEWDGYAVGDLLRESFGDRKPLMAVDAAGALPYWSDLPSLDMLGLNDRYLARHPPSDFGGKHIGHDLGNGQYVWERNPDLILFRSACGTAQPGFRSGQELMSSPQFFERYHFVRAQGAVGNRAIAEMYVRKDGGPLGFRHDGDKTTIPGYFFTKAAPAQLGRSGRLVVPVSVEAPAHLSRVRLTRGTWTVSTVPASRTIATSFLCANESTTLPAGSKSVSVLSLESESMVDIVLSLAPGETQPLQLEAVILTRSDASEAEAAKCAKPGEPARLSGEDLSVRKAEGTYWAEFGNNVFASRALQVCWRDVKRALSLDMSADNNDSYAIRFLLGGRLVGRMTVGPRPNDGGLTVYHEPIEPRPAGVDCVEIEGRGGDGLYSVGHVVLEDE